MSTSISKIKNILSETGLLKDAEFGFDLSRISSLKAGGRCSCFLRIERRSDLILLVKRLVRDSSIKCYPVGDCTNILFNDGKIDILIIRLGNDFNYVDFSKNGEISAGASTNLQKFIVLSAINGHDYSFLAGIPGTVGGAVIGSSGTRVQSINQLVSRIKYIYRSGKEAGELETEIDGSQHSYRVFSPPGVFLLTDIYFKKRQAAKKSISVTKSGIKSDTGEKPPAKDKILEKIRNNIKIKKNSQPLDLKSAGCFFKNPQNPPGSAGEIIESCGFKGFRFGSAMVSCKHANYIINAGNSTAKDIYVLSKIIKDRVGQKYKIDLEYEVRLVGF